ncbi:unnamed protein product [Durusdinium trenchii]|uniref:Uncharacterized protein n=1 Tax=Durusdinium trenchii TaxID=1381693 RepID=A0ABP0L321_9DINO
MEQRLACLLDAVTSADPAAVVPDAVAGRVVECLSAEIGHCLPVFGGETCFRELLPLQKSCARCDSHLAKIASAKAVATIVHTGGLVRKDHIPCRCRNKNCDMYGSLIWRNYFVDAGRHFFLGHPQDLKCFMVSSSFGFSIEWLEDFHSRVVRQHASFISESDVIQQRAVRHGQTAWLPVARLRKMISEAWFKWRLLVRGYAYNIPGVAQNPIDIHQGVEDLLKPVLPALQKAFSDAAVASARSANMRRDVIVMDGNAKNRRAVCAALLCGRKQSLSLNKTLRHNCPATPALGHLFCAKHNTDDVAAAPQDLEESYFVCLLALAASVVAMSRDVEYLPAMKKIWDAVGKMWQPADILTAKGHQMCQTWAVRASHPEYPYALHLLSMMAPLTNGAAVQIFPTASSPLVAFGINVNYSQTQKSSCTSHADSITRVLDSHVRQKTQTFLNQMSVEQDFTHDESTAAGQRDTQTCLGTFAGGSGRNARHRQRGYFPGEMPPELPATQDFAADYLPSSAGYPVRLLDGNMSRLRFRRDPRVPSGFTAEWRVANRAFPVPPEFQLEAAVLRVTEYFSVPHMKLDLTPEAQQMHMSYQGGLNVQSHMARERADPVGGARLGAAPWHIGVLAGLLLVYEIFSGVYSADRLQQKDLQVHTIKDIALGEDAASPNPQPQPAEVQPDFDALVGADPLPFPGGDFADSIVDDAAASHSPELPPETEPLRVADVRSIEFGYGPDGASVQSAFHSKHLTDRFIMKATLLHGHPKVTSKTICDKLRSSRESGRKALPREDWVAVMEACAGSPILDFQDDTLQLRAIPQDAPGRTFYHNELMKLCGVTMRELMTAMNRAAAAKAKSAAPPKRKRQDGHED